MRDKVVTKWLHTNIISQIEIENDVIYVISDEI